MMAAMQARQADVTYYPPHFSIDTMKRVPGITVQQQKDYIYDVFVGFRVSKPVVDDPAIRRAANMAISQEAIAKAVYFGYGTPLRSLLSPAVVDFDAEAAAMMPPYDPAGAAKVLDEAGWKPSPDGIRVKNGQWATFLIYGLRNDTGRASRRRCRRICAGSASTCRSSSGTRPSAGASSQPRKSTPSSCPIRREPRPRH